jgi:hypothetical protein
MWLSIVHVSGRDQDCEQQAQAGKNNITLSAVDVFGVVSTAFFATTARVNRLAVDTDRSSRRIRFLDRADFAAESIMNRFQRVA